MNILISNQSQLVCYGTDFTITAIENSWSADGVKIGILVEGATLIENVAPPELFILNVYSYKNGVWTIVNQESYDAVVEGNKNTFNAEQKKKRFAAYNLESDPIYFKSQRGEATNQEWLDKIAQIDARFPYQE